MSCQNVTVADPPATDSRFRGLAESGIVGIFEGDETGRILKANAAFLQMLGYSQEDFDLGLVRWDRMTVPGYEQHARRFHEQLIDYGIAAPVEMEYFRKDGSRIPVMVGLSSVGGVPGYRAIGFMQDLSAKCQAEDALRRSEEKFRQLAENIDEVFWMMDAAATEILYVSPAYEQVWGQKCENLYADAENWSRSIHPEDLPGAMAVFGRQTQGEVLENEYRIVQPSGDIRWIRDRAFPVRDGEGNIVRLAGVAEDITERKLSELLLVRQNLHDDLTGLPNRRHFREKLTCAINECEAGKSVAIFFIDLDQFKLVNDTLGHAEGDRLLVEVVQRLLGVCGGSGTLARFGGDEFTFLGTGFDGPEPVRRLGERLIGCLDEPFRVADRDVYVGASIGVSLFPVDGTDARLLKRSANLAMHEAKRCGKNQLKFFSAGLAEAAGERLEMETRIRGAITRSEFRLQYQPQFIAGESRPGRFEALIRWCPPGEPMVPPLKFIPIVEQNGLIVPIGTWVLREACLACASWQMGNLRGVGVAVNVSAPQFACPDFVSIVMQTLEETLLPAGLLELELTESVFVNDFEASAQTLKELRSLGLTIALDDFGTGYSSLSYLQRLPLDALKIDRSFVTETESKPQRAAVLRCVVDLAHAHGLRVVGEGVETVAQLELLGSLGCDETQGYLLGRPSFDVTAFDRSPDFPAVDSAVSEQLRLLSGQMSIPFAEEMAKTEESVPCR